MRKYKTKRGKYHEWLTDEGLIKIEGWAMDGLSDEQIAHNIGIVPSTLYEWKKKYSEISEALRKGKEIIDRQVENALLKRALGFEYEEIKMVVEKDEKGRERKRQEKSTKTVAPDTGAIAFWLKNRKPDTWRDKPSALDEEEQRVRIDKTKAQTRAINGIAEDIEDRGILKELVEWND